MDSPLFWMMKKSRAMLPYMPKWTYPLFCSLAYLICIRKVLHLRKPRTFTEKIQWMKFHDSTEMKSRLSDKYLVKEWVREKIGDQYVIPLLGAWDTFDEIDFDDFAVVGHGELEALVRRVYAIFLRVVHCHRATVGPHAVGSSLSIPQHCLCEARVSKERKGK